VNSKNSKWRSGFERVDGADLDAVDAGKNGLLGDANGGRV
jgi:hypothetical protein